MKPHLPPPVTAFLVVASAFLFFVQVASAANLRRSEPSLCDSLKFIALFYTQTISHQEEDSTSVRSHYMGLGYQSGILKKWSSDALGGNLMTSGFFQANHCGAVYPSGKTCSVGLWDGKTNCFVTGITENANPSYVIRNFAGTKDLLFLIYDFTGNGEFRQMLLYRPGVGSVFSRVITPFKSNPRLQTEELLDSVVYEAKTGIHVIPRPPLPPETAFDTATAWMRTIRLRDTKDGQILSIDWDSVRTKVRSYQAVDSSRPITAK